MKKFILSGLAFMTYCSLQAQVTINKSDLAQLGDTLYYGWDTTNITVNMATTSGASQTWDFTGAVNNVTGMSWFIDPANSPVSAPPNITHVLIDGDVSSVTFLNATDTALYNIQPNPAYGFIGGEAFLGVKALSFPLNFQDLTTDSVASVSTVPGSSIGIGALADSVRISVSVGLISDCDAWGTLKTPKSTYSALRIKNTITTKFKFEGKKSPIPFWFSIPVSALPVPIPEKQVEITYMWLGANGKYALAEASMATDSETERDNLRWQTDKPVISSGLSSLVKNNVEVNTYPNPASTEINLRFHLNNAAAMQVGIYDVNGRLVNSFTESCTAGINTLTISTDDLAAGLYHIVISGNGRSAAVKASVIK